MKIYIYGLYDPIELDSIRYVGQTSNLKNRLVCHTSGNCPLTKQWVESVEKMGRPVCLKILEETDALNARAREGFWISQCPKAMNIDRGPDCIEFRVSPIIPMRDMQVLYARWAVDRFDGNKRAAALALGVGRQTLYNILERDGIVEPGADTPQTAEAIAPNVV